MDDREQQEIEDRRKFLISAGEVCGCNSSSADAAAVHLFDIGRNRALRDRAQRRRQARQQWLGQWR